MRTNTYIGALDGGEGAAAELGINVAPAEVVDNDDVVALIGKVKGGGPAAETVATEDDDLLLLGGAVGADTVNVGSVLKCLHDEGGALGRGGLAGFRHGSPGGDESARRGREGRRKAGEDGGKEEDLHFSTQLRGEVDSARTLFKQGNDAIMNDHCCSQEPPVSGSRASLASPKKADARK